ncbi:hypothetical protein LTR70_008512 [Exophiala xenobiotica]|uniref:Uncharacterized protein n=1 Tax=Lithohypha guttulata TaxID=1690604 RepID=A0ABR0K2U8_9EURO|nr:hypothetical protein LTR24_008136 [Lithohypha guttulata]KAK5311864.1 hypothetical protein LTR70_008512 [Exophiala xenobiotica]
MSRKGPSTTGAASFSPDTLHTDTPLRLKTRESLNNNDLATAIKTTFHLAATDKYTYHASASVTLSQVQAAVAAGPANGLQAWYVEFSTAPNTDADADGVGSAERLQRATPEYRCPPPPDIAAYVALFDPAKPAANLLRGFGANAKKGSLRADIAAYLASKRYVHPSVTVSKLKKGADHDNIYADFWAWSCFSLNWAGPDARSANLRLSHHVLPVFMHHFGCVCPSYEALEIVKAVSKGRAGAVLDVGSGNGYWTYMLRRQGVEVFAVDNGQSAWRTLWIGDTVTEDGAKYVRRRPGSGKDDVLLMVYPVVGLAFTTSVLDAYRGDVICVAGTQNGNGYTGFKDEMIDSWMARERNGFEKIVQVPLPSFAGKDDALFVFRRKEGLAPPSMEDGQ